MRSETLYTFIDSDMFQVDDTVLDGYLSRLFSLADTNCDGVLQPLEFLELLCGSGLNLPDDLILNMFMKVIILTHGTHADFWIIIVVSV